MSDFKLGWDKLRRLLSIPLTWTGVQTFLGLITATGGVKPTVTSHGASESITAATMYGNMHLVTGAYTLTFPALVVGMSGRIRATTAAVYSLDLTTGTDIIILNGTALTAGYKATSNGEINNQMAFRCDISGYIVVNSDFGLAIDGGA